MERSGSSVVLTMAGTLVAIAGVFGYALGAAALPTRIDGELPMAAFGPIAFEITPLSMALYGMVIVALGLAAALGVLTVIAEHDDAALD